MTTTAERAAPTEAPEREREGEGRAFEALLLAALASRQEDRAPAAARGPGPPR
ncbi:hypothetical protein [Streptosporangium roseum]|uniref:hypothetical protein n=1 Tax=Streptosporangium roseum TaxID=2001 RepID=UPI0012DD1E97|nr:hypothetical protein [Streptosporangium roseum]